MQTCINTFPHTCSYFSKTEPWGMCTDNLQGYCETSLCWGCSNWCFHRQSKQASMFTPLFQIFKYLSIPKVKKKKKRMVPFCIFVLLCIGKYLHFFFFRFSVLCLFFYQKNSWLAQLYILRTLALSIMICNYFFPTLPFPLWCDYDFFFQAQLYFCVSLFPTSTKYLVCLR